MQSHTQHAGSSPATFGARLGRRQRHHAPSGAALVSSVLLALHAAFAPTVAQAALDAKEESVVSFVKAHQDEAVALLERVVNIASGTMNFAGVRQVAEAFRPHFEALGFKTRWVDGEAFGRAGHLIAERGGRGPHILLIGHIDTVFDGSARKFERVDANIVRGPGTSDMKGGVVVALTALGALSQAGALDALKLTVVLHGDEESAGTPLELARRDLIEAAKAADIAIGLENADDNPSTAVTARRSSSRWKLRVTAKSSHSSQIFSDTAGAGAIYELARILNRFYEELRHEQYLTLNPGVVAGGVNVEFAAEPLQGSASGKDNIIAPEAVASGDLRAISAQQRSQAQERMRKIVAESLPQAKAEITFVDNYPPMAPTEGNRRLLERYDRVSRDLGFGPVTAVNPRNAGAADVSFAADHVEMAIDGLGLLGGGAHTPEEFADLRKFQIQAQRLAVLLYRLGKDRGGR
jgi:glutamate carboxypeptidase